MGVCVGCAGLWIYLCAGTPHFFSIQFSFICHACLLLLLLLLLLLAKNVCITPCLKLSSSLLCGSHGTTAVAQQVCVDHIYACVATACACVTCAMTRKRKRKRKRARVCVCVCVFDICTLFSGARGSFLVLSAAGHAGDPPVHHGASLGLGRALWRVLWAFKVAKSGK